MKILQLLYKVPFPLHDGGEYSLYHSTLSLLVQPEVELKVVAMNLARSSVHESDLPQDFCKRCSYEQVDIDNRIKSWGAFLNLFSSESYFVERFRSEAYSQKLVQLLRENKYDVILVEHAHLTIYVPLMRQHSRAKIILRHQDMEYRIWERIIAQEKNIAKSTYLRLCNKRLERFEKECFNSYDGIITFTGEDQREVNRTTNKPVRVIPIGYDAARYSDVKDDFSRVTFYHLGSMDWQANVQSMKWFVNDVLPLVAEQRPDVKVHIAGKNMPQWFFDRASDHLIVEGRVPDSRQYQSDKTVLLVPLLSGSGIRVKIIEALAMGKTVVSTKLGATGIDCPSVFLADTPHVFADEMVRCMDSRHQLATWAQQSREYARNNFDVSVLGQKKLQFFHSIPG
jgi:glycosyltransferase involved in cell wall biosynthesis